MAVLVLGLSPVYFILTSLLENSAYTFPRNAANAQVVKYTQYALPTQRRYMLGQARMHVLSPSAMFNNSEPRTSKPSILLKLINSLWWRLSFQLQCRVVRVLNEAPPEEKPLR